MQLTRFTLKKRLIAFSMGMLIILLALITRLGYIQLVWGSELQARALDQWTRDVPLRAVRGTIVDVNGREIVVSKTVFTIYVRPKSVVDATETATVLSQVLQKDYYSIYEKIVKKGVSEVTIAKQVSAESAGVIRQYNLNGVYLTSESVRSYVYGDFLSQVLGFVSSDGVGQTGLETSYDKYLAGTSGKLLTQSDLIGRELLDERMYYIPAVDGYTVKLTIDYVIQQTVENTLDIIMQAHGAQSARCIVMDVTDGSILAMSSKPSYNLNELPRDDVELLMEYSRNTLLTDVYEPGSTFKVLTAAASIQESLLGNPNAFDENYVFLNNSGTRIISGGKISCWTKHVGDKHSNQTIGAALTNSCNPIFTDIALSLGTDTMYKYIKAFGYGSKSGIDFIGEQAGLLISQSSVKIGDLARIGFGQSIAVTALQLCMATAAAVNGGELLKPYLVSEIIDTNTGLTVLKNSKVVRNQAISAEASKIIASMLKGVVENGGGKNAYIEGYEVGGKTGTAQKYVNGVIAQGKNVSSFIGFFPASSPKYLCLIIVDEPVGVSYGSMVAAPYAKVIFQQIINYYDIPPVS